jgi:hypothetical protein
MVNRFYPTGSGVVPGRSIFSILAKTQVDGIDHLAFGLGKLIVEGGNGLRVSPRYPTKLLQLSTVESTLRDTQRSCMRGIWNRPFSGFPWLLVLIS